VVRLETVCGETNDFDITPLKIGGTARDFSKFGRADRSKVIGMGEKNGLLSIVFNRCRMRGKRKIQANPGVTDPFVEPDATLSRLSFKIRGGTSKAKSRHGF
jgi:hypothetical protein